MNKSYIRAFLTLTALSFSEQVTANGLTNRDYQMAKKNISDDAITAKKDCELLVNKDKDICLVNAKKSERNAKNKLEARFKKRNKIDNKMTTTNTVQVATEKHSTQKIDRLRRP
jgi:hypothetical protein